MTSEAAVFRPYRARRFESHVLAEGIDPMWEPREREARDTVALCFLVLVESVLIKMAKERLDEDGR